MKILMTLMKLEIGGAETHVVELARELASRGYDITVASNGGVYEKELSDAGIKHVKLPLHSKSPSCLLKSYIGLKKLIRREKFDIVHAHARIPALICGSLSKKLHFRFVTSAHFDFKVNPFLTRVTDWGEHSIAVSYDLKQYLIDNYRMCADNISVTINGINTEKFSANIDSSDVIGELSLSENCFRVVYVSRIDSGVADAGFVLCDAAEELSKKIPQLEVLMVGGGDLFDKLKARAGEVNKTVGREMIRLAGPRTDVARLLSAGDVFVGVSRAALEAMSEEKPVILAGAQGYIGIFRRELLKLAEGTNFCCRGEKKPAASMMVDDIFSLYSMGAEERKKLGEDNRRVILEKYSVKRMADDYAAVYSKMTPYKKYRSGDIIISGYYGFDNMGDDSLLTSIIGGIKKLNKDARITVLTKSTERTAARYGVKTINRMNFPAIVGEMKHASLLISGGGSLLQDGTSKKSLMYYVYIMKLAAKYNMKVMIMANGLGPLCSADSRKKAAKAICAADYVSFRENRSKELAEAIGVDREKISVSADPAFLLDGCEEKWTDHLIKRLGFSGRFFIVSVKEGNNYQEKSANPAELFAGDIKKISEKYSMIPIYIPMHPVHDISVAEALCRKAGTGIVAAGLSASELCGLMERCDLVVGTRLHTLIFAASVGVPMIGISYDPKVDSFLEYIGMGSCSLDVRTVRPGDLSALADTVMGESEKIRMYLPECAEKMRKLAKDDCSWAVRLAYGDDNK